MPKHHGYLLLAVTSLCLVAATPGFPAEGRRQPAETPARGDARGAATGQVLSRDGKPIAGALITVEGARAGQTSANGTFAIRRQPAERRLAVSFTAKGYVGTTRIIRLPAKGELGLSPVVLLARAHPTTLDAGKGGRVPIGDGGALVIPPNALTDRRGRPVQGPVEASVTSVDVLDREELRAAPGDFRAMSADGRESTLRSFGVFDILISDTRGRELVVAKGTELPVTLRIPERLGARAPERIGLYRFEVTTGYWVGRGALTMIEPLVYTGMVTGSGAWNADEPVDTTCITVRVARMDAVTQVTTPMANSHVYAYGVAYVGASSGFTNASGLVCLLVRQNSQIELKAFGPGNWSSPNSVFIQSPNVQSGAADCGSPIRCPLVADVPVDLVVGLQSPRPRDPLW